MCEALRELMKDDIQEAEIKAYVDAGRDFKASEDDIIKGIMSKFGVAFEVAKKYVLPAMA